uniref:Biogenesis of lysosome-related organelles complex 1 subunit 1 n=1 Tax=Panagrellus redivivus TaxID=6233 RepID=A0A7E4VMU1_PANRE
MLPELVKEAATKQQYRKELQERRKNEAIVAAHAFSNSIVDHLNSKVSHAYHNQKRIDVESKKLGANAGALLKQAEEWAEIIESFTDAIKELGDVKTWGSVIENDMKIVAATMSEVRTQCTPNKAAIPENPKPEEPAPSTS